MNNITKKIAIVSMLLLLASCGKAAVDTDGGVEVDAGGVKINVDADGGVEVDTDDGSVDVDAEGKVEVDTDADMEADMEADADMDAEGEEEADSDVKVDAEAGMVEVNGMTIEGENVDLGETGEIEMEVK